MNYVFLQLISFPLLMEFRKMELIKEPCLKERNTNDPHIIMSNKLSFLQYFQ